MPSAAKTSFIENKKDVERLWEIHQEVAGKGAGRKRDVEVLNRTAIVLITACWESYVEDVAKESLDFLLANTPNSQCIPAKVRAFIAQPYLKQEDPRKLWELTDSGWKTIILAKKSEIIENWLGSFNTPKPAQVNQLFDELLGIKKISEKWRWKNMTKTKASEKLEQYVTIRGNIAHRIRHDEQVYKNWSTDYLNHIEGLVDATESAISDHLQGITAKAPW
ncbi:MAG: HEPN domain-containing protein [Roseateles sp.]